LTAFFVLGVNETAEAVKVMVGVPPYSYLAARIGGSHVEINTLLEAGRDPHTFEPAPKKVMALSGSQIFFSAGLPFERQVIRRIQGNLCGLRVVDLSEGLGLIPIDHDADGEHEEHEAHDPHIWLSPSLLVGQAAKMARTLEEVDPQHAKEYENNLLDLQRDLLEVRQRLDLQLAPFRGRSFLVYHPAFAYFGREFGLRQVALTDSGGRTSPRQLTKLVELARKEGVRIVFVQPQFDQHKAQILAAAIGGAVIPIDPLAPDLLLNFTKIAQAMEGALK